MSCEIMKAAETSVAYALFRLPFADEFTFIAQTSGEVKRLRDVSELEGKRGFTMIPFAPGRTGDILLIRPDVERSYCVSAFDDESLRCEVKEVGISSGKDDYLRAFSVFHGAVADGRFDKLVLSRKKEVALSSFSPLCAFLKACCMYPRMMVYLCSVPGAGTWMGCTPEILLSGSKSHYRTVALAGTMKMTADMALAEEKGGRTRLWSEKNRKEQGVVADYIRERLRPFAGVVEEEGPYTSRAGQLLHLKTEFHFSPKRKSGLCDIVKELHPTPAVCGMPKEEAMNFILKHEGYDRSYYSGAVGMFDPCGRTDLYVNLRCASIGDDGRAVLYAGGGILASSVAESEWEETEEKLKTIGNVFN